MGEPIWCNIHVKYPKTWGRENPLVEGLEYALADSEVEFDDGLNDDAHFELMRFGGSGNYGLYDDDVMFWLDWLRDYKVPFVATSETKYEYAGETIVNNGQREWTGESSVDSAVLSRTAYQEIIDGVSQFQTPGEFFEILNTATPIDFPIDHLPAAFPDDDDEVLLINGGPLDVVYNNNIGQLKGTRSDLLLLARHIHDHLEEGPT